MQKTILDEVPDHMRLQVLQDSADSIEDTTYLKQLTQEELDLKREQYFENQIKVTALQEELTGIKKSYKERMEPLALENKTLLQEVRTKQTEISGTLYHLANHDTGFMETYNETGELIGTRRLRPNEKQKNIFSLSKASND